MADRQDVHLLEQRCAPGGFPDSDLSTASSEMIGDDRALVFQNWYKALTGGSHPSTSTASFTGRPGAAPSYQHQAPAPAATGDHARTQPGHHQ
jgi:hypothetical protein